MEHLNIGILAHVDAGKTSLTEQLLQHTGVIERAGRVEHGDTRTDSMDMERRRGITVRSAVVALPVGDVLVNLIDTPGHPDFIGEVQRVLRVLDAVVLVVSAVEGVQAQTRVLMRTLTRLHIPVLVFVNKIDRPGARDGELLAELTDRLGVTCVRMSDVERLGSPAVCVRPRDVVASAGLAELLAEHSDVFLAAYLDGDRVLTTADHRAELVRQIGAGVATPVWFGSARTGEGVAALVDGIPALLTAPAGPVPDDELRADVFGIERGPARERIAWVRVFSGELTARQTVRMHRPGPAGAVTFEARPTAVRVVEHGTDTVDAPARAGRIAAVTGLRDVRIGDRIGVTESDADGAHFPPPTLEAVVRPLRPAGPRALFAALTELAEQDPLIGVRLDEDRRITVRLYGEVQKEVVHELLAEQYGIEVEFDDTRTICVERPVGTAEAVWEIDDGRNPFVATLGLRVGPGSGRTFGLDVELGGLPLSFHTAIRETVEAASQCGPHGWEVVDCAVTVTRTGYDSPVSVAGDFRGITRLVLAEALRLAGTEVLEPVSGFELELPADAVAASLSRLAELDGSITGSQVHGARAELTGTLPTAHVHRFTRQLPGLTRGEGLLVTEPAGYDSYRSRDQF